MVFEHKDGAKAFEYKIVAIAADDEAMYPIQWQQMARLEELTSHEKVTVFLPRGHMVGDIIESPQRITDCNSK